MGTISRLNCFNDTDTDSTPCFKTTGLRNLPITRSNFNQFAIFFTVTNRLKFVKTSLNIFHHTLYMQLLYIMMAKLQKLMQIARWIRQKLLTLGTRYWYTRSWMCPRACNPLRARLGCVGAIDLEKLNIIYLTFGTPWNNCYWHCNWWIAPTTSSVCASQRRDTLSIKLCDCERVLKFN